MSGKIRTRFAPSPTGKMHVGNLRTALYAYLITKHEDGDFLLRIEDTDRERLVEGAVDIIYRTLAKAGLSHDEGPDKDKGFGPYVQSERMATGMYMEYAKELVEKGAAYYCFCTKERLDSLKNTESKDIAKYDKHCETLSKEEIQKNLDAGIPFVIRQSNPTEGETTFTDVIFGDITVDNSELDDMVLMKSDGYPTYNFANVIDDHTMEITHVVRGNEYLASSPKYNRLYEAFGWPIPTYVHVPLITDENHKKLSKRSGHSSYEDLLEQGFVNDAIMNFISLLGWNPGTNEEIFSMEELREKFDYKQISKSSAVFDMKKFRWMNGEYIKKMEDDKFFEISEEQLKKVITKPELDLKKISNMVKSRTEVLTEIPEKIAFFNELPEYSTDLYIHKKMKTNPENSLENLEKVLPVLENVTDWNKESLHELIMAFVKELGIKNGMMLWPLRTALSGVASTPGGAFDLADVLGKDESIHRIKEGIELLKK